MPLPLRCIACGYDLSDADPRGPCPECAASVRDALRLPIRRWADEGWIRRVRRGLGLGAAAMGLHIVALLCLTLTLPISMLIDPRFTSVPMAVIMMGAYGLWGLAYMLGMPACWITGRARLKEGARSGPLEAARVTLFWLPAIELVTGALLGLLGIGALALVQQFGLAVGVVFAGFLFGIPLVVVNGFVARGLIQTGVGRDERRAAADTIERLPRLIFRWCVVGGLTVAIVIFFVSQTKGQGWFDNPWLRILAVVVWLVGGVSYAAMAAWVLRSTLRLRSRLGRLLGK